MRWGLIILQFLFACAIYGQSAYVKISIDSAAVPAGYNFTVNLESFSEDGIIYPQIPDKSKLDTNWYILNISDLIQEDSADFIRYKFSFNALINSFGVFKVEPEIWFKTIPDNTLIESDEIEIYSVKLDENGDIKPNESYVKAKWSSAEITFMIVGSLLLIILIFYFVKFIKNKNLKKSKPKFIKNLESEIDLFQNCMDELAKLEFNPDKSDHYYSQLMIVFKDFCTNYYNKDFKVLTDSEFLNEMQDNKDFGVKNFLKLETIINEIKYAKSQVYKELAAQHLDMLKQILFDIKNKNYDR